MPLETALIGLLNGLNRCLLDQKMLLFLTRASMHLCIRLFVEARVTSVLAGVRRRVLLLSAQQVDQPFIGWFLSERHLTYRGLDSIGHGCQ